MSNQIKLLIVSIIVLIVSGILVWFGIYPAVTSSTITQRIVSEDVLGQTQESTSSATTNSAYVTRIIDGDTIEVEITGNKYTLRYVGVNTPETVDPRRPVQCFGKQASDENKRLVADKVIRIEKDVSDTDKYGRLLRLVYLPLDDGTELFVNDYLVREGFAQASTFPPDVKFSEQFKKAEIEAKDNNRGLWGECN